jgi:hypothetical protein
MRTDPPPGADPQKVDRYRWFCDREEAGGREPYSWEDWYRAAYSYREITREMWRIAIEESRKYKQKKEDQP